MNLNCLTEKGESFKQFLLKYLNLYFQGKNFEIHNCRR